MSTLKTTNIAHPSSASNNIVLDSSGNVVLQAGSASTPALQPSGDTNTGIFFPAADTIAFAEGGSEAMRIDSAARLLVGTSTSLDSYLYQVDSSGAATASFTRYTADAATVRIGSSRGTQGSRTALNNGDSGGIIQFDGYTGTAFSSLAYIGAVCDGQAPANGDSPGRLVFSTTADGASSPTERMRLQANGKLLLGTTSSNYGNFYQLEVDGGASDAQLNKTSAGAGAGCFGAWNSATSGNNGFIFFFTESSITLRGSIDYNRAAGQVRYNVTSDRRLKSNIQDSESALSTLDQIKVRSYTWTETGYGVEYGFVAQELNEVAPDAVKVGDDGDEVVDTWAVDNAKLVPLLTKALQEALQKIDAMEARLSALEAS